MLGPAMGYALASYSLKMFVAPSLTPTITTNDPRWIGAWWFGWMVMGFVLGVMALFIGLFPKNLPRAAARKEYQMLQLKSPKQEKNQNEDHEKADEDLEEHDEVPASMNDLKNTIKRLLKNKVLMLNNWASVFYLFGFTPYWIFTPKYMESQYKQSASSSK